MALPVFLHVSLFHLSYLDANSPIINCFCTKQKHLCYFWWQLGYFQWQLTENIYKIITVIIDCSTVKSPDSSRGEQTETLETKVK